MKYSVDSVWVNNMSYTWIDTHAHLMSDGMYENFEDIKRNAHEHNVHKICIICGNLQQVERFIKTCEDDPMFDMALGVHPTSAKEVSQEEFQKMLEYVKHPQVKFIGEIGLDYYWDDSYKDIQKDYFIRQIEIANKYNLPISIHMRDSSDDVYEILKAYPVNRKGIAHCFTDGVVSAQRFIDLGYYIGVGGIVTFKNGENVQALIKELPFDKILSETDSPYLSPVPFRGKPNQPAYVSYVGKEIAKLKGISEEEALKQLESNYKTLLEAL